jgi:pilus assembly protein CpaF
MEEEIVSMQDVFMFEKRGVSAEGRVNGAFMATGVRPRFAERLKAAGIQVPTSWFEHSFTVS